MRAHVSKTLREDSGALIAGASVRVLNAASNTLIPGVIYTAATGNESLTNPFVATTGLISFYLALPQRVRFGVTPVDGPEVFYEDVDVIIPSARSNTVGHPLPPTEGRTEGDMHYDDTDPMALVPYVLAGDPPEWVETGGGGGGGGFAKGTGLGSMVSVDLYNAADDGYDPAVANGNDTLAIGPTAIADGQQAIAIGSQAQAHGSQAQAFGESASAFGNQPLAIGNTAIAGDDGLPLSDPKNNQVMALGNSAQAMGSQAMAMGNTAGSYGTQGTAVGNSATATSNSGTAVGNSATAGSSWQQSHADDTSQASAFGNTATASGDRDTVLGAGGLTRPGGADNTVVGTDSVARTDANAPVSRSVVIGSNATVKEDDHGVIKVDQLEVVPSSPGGHATALAVRDTADTKHTLGVNPAGKLLVDGTPLSGPAITQGAGLPPFTGRKASDLHYDQTTGKTNILTGAAGVTVTDSFNRASLGTTSEEGVAYAVPAGPNPGPAVLDGTAWAAQPTADTHLAFQLGASLATAGASLATTIVVGTTPSNVNMYLGCALNGSNVPTATGYRFLISQHNIYIIDAFTGSTLANLNGAGTVGLQPGETHIWEATLDAALNLAIKRDGVTQLTATGATAITNTYGAIRADATNPTTTKIDALAALSYGSLAWTFTEPIYVQAQLASGNVATGTHVLKPGVRVPTDSTLREVILRCDTAPTGASITVEVERFNNGVSQGVIATASITTGNTVGVATGLSAGCAKGDILKFNITSVGSTVAGADLTASLDFH